MKMVFGPAFHVLTSQIRFPIQDSILSPNISMSNISAQFVTTPVQQRMPLPNTVVDCTVT